MRNDIYPINHLPPVIPVGIQSEHGVREVRFDVSPWLEVWPGMYCEVWNTRPGESEAYRTVSVMEGDILTWNVNEVDTEKEGLGKVEIVGMTPDGERKKHAGPVDTAVKATSIAMTQEMPESHVPYYEALMASNADAKAVTGENARVAQEAALKAQEHKLNAGVSEENAKIYMNTASEKAKESAESAAKAAASVQDSRQAAETAGQHSSDAATSAQNAWEATKKMPIVGENGNWYVWSPSTGSYTDSGVPAQGPEGKKEMFFVTITTGSNGKLTSTQSYGNILYADQEGKFIVGRLDGAWPLEFVGSVEGGVMFRHIRYYSANANEPTICAEEFVVKHNGEVTWSTRAWKAPNPHPLTITGATSATYDGSSAVTLDVPNVLVVTTSVVDGKSKANYTSEEFRASYHNNIALLKMDQVCYIFSGYESLLPKFARPAFVTNMNRIRCEYATIGADGFITRTFNEYGIRNPSSLVFTGAVNATYDGGSRVTVNIPAGGGGGGGSIPDPGTAHQQLVSDADGKAVWDDRTHYTEYTDVVVLEQTTLPVIADEGMAYLTEAPIAEPTDGGEYNVKWNGADYTCKAAKTEMDGIACVMIGNAMAFGGDDTGEPFVALFLPADTAAALGAYAMIVPLDGSAEIVLSISGKSEVVHKLHEKYLPNLPTNLVNGSTPYSLRQKSAAEEDAEYMLGSYASAFGYNTKAIGQQSHAEGTGTIASGDDSHAEGWDTKASSMSAHAEGFQTTASGDHSHAEGTSTTASGDASHAEGRSSKATAEAAHAEGAQTTAEGDYSHAEGKETMASEESAHAEGYKTTAEGMYSHAEGRETVAIGHGSHAEGLSTIARSEYQHVQGKFNVPELQLAGKYAHIVGNGKDINNRSNAHTLDWDGNAWFAGDVYVGGDGKDDGERLVKASEFSALSEDIAELKGDAKPSEVTYEPNLDGYMRNTGQIWTSTANCYHTDYIPLDGYNRIVAKAYLISSGYALAFFDAAQTLLHEVSIVGAGGDGHPNSIDMGVPDGAVYCMLSNYLGSDGTNHAFITLYAEDADAVSSVLRGKKIAFLGDSITSTNYTTPNYWQMIEEKTGMLPLNYGVSASRIATVDGDNKESFVTRAAAMDASADAVVVMGGTNDCNLNTVLGEWASTDESTFYGALNALIALLRTNYPGKPIIFCTPIKRKYDTDGGFPATMADLKTTAATEVVTMELCALAIKAKCARHGIPVIDLTDHSGIGAECPEYYIDNLHPSALGYVRIANMVQAELEKQFMHTAD